MSALLRYLFFLLFVRPLVFLLLGVNVRGRERLPKKGPAILVANHNSHLDTAVLMCLFPMDELRRVHPVAAADYWLRNKFIAYFALRIVGVIPITRERREAGAGDPLAAISTALEKEAIVIFFPEGTRGEPERMGKFKSGIARLAEKHPQVPIVPVYLHGAGKALPRGEGVLVPFICDALIGEAVWWNGNREAFLRLLEQRLAEEASAANFPAWE